MTTQWKEVRLGDYMSIMHGYAFSGNYITNVKTENVLLTPGNFNVGGGFNNSKFKFYSNDGEIPTEYILNKNDIVVTMTDLSKESDTLGYPAKVPLNSNYIYLHNQRLGKVVFNCEGLDKEFLFYLLHSDTYRNEILASSSGTSIKHTAPKRIEAYRFLRPPLQEQQAIAEVLGAFDDKIELNSKMNKTLEETAQALFKSWFVDFDPVHAKACLKDKNYKGPASNPMTKERAKKILSMLPDDVASLFPDSFEPSKLGDIPKGWKTRSLYDSAKYINGGAYKDFHPSGEECALPIIKIAELKNGITGQTKYTKIELSEKYKIGNGEILLSWSGNPDTSIDTFIWTGDSGWLNQHIFRVLPNIENEKYFIYYFLKYLRPTLAEIARDKQTTGLGHFTISDMKRTIVIYPPNEILCSFNDLVSAIFENWYGNLIETNTNVILRDTLLPKLMSGEVRIKDVEKFVENM